MMLSRLAGVLLIFIPGQCVERRTLPYNWDIWSTHPKEREEKEKATEIIFEDIPAENVSNLGKVLDIQVQETESPKEDTAKEDHIKTCCN